ncbi:hypothetical protein [Dietzia sp. ANT_WB102]|uniref:hypothetical protein n=1 Tax=Dietzia sp. ANT_WB102 TaxID=2597345 RepID=UPI00165EAE4E|nr:hypothetical protein [Dietzia sp. ANT_WB102]
MDRASHEAVAWRAVVVGVVVVAVRLRVRSGRSTAVAEIEVIGPEATPSPE